VNKRLNLNSALKHDLDQRIKIEIDHCHGNYKMRFSTFSLVVFLMKAKRIDSDQEIE
jgi:hypothetical protein